MMVATFPLTDAQSAENARVIFQQLYDGVLPSALDCGKHQKLVDLVSKRYKSSPESNRKDSLSSLFREFMKASPEIATLLPVDLRAKTGETLASEKSQPVVASQDDEMHTPALPALALLGAQLSQGVCPELGWFEQYAARMAYRTYSGFFCSSGLALFSGIAAGRPRLRIGTQEFTTNLNLVHCADTSLDAKSHVYKNVVEFIARNLDLAFLFRSGLRLMTPEKFLVNLAGRHVPDNWDDQSAEEKLSSERARAFCAQVVQYVDEGGEFLDALFAKNSNLAKYIQLILELYASPPDFDGSDTIGRGAEKIYNPSISLVMSLTVPDIARVGYQGSRLWAKGFLGRLNFVMADEITEEEIHRRMAKARNLRGFTDPPALLMNSLSDWHQRLGIPRCQVVTEQGEDGKLKHTIDRDPLSKTFYTIDEAAEEAWLNYTEALQILSLSLPSDLRGNYGRLPETAMRMALLFASLGDTNGNHRVELKHWAKAQEMAEFFRGHLHKLYARVAVPPESPAKRLQDKILAYLAKNAEKWIDTSDLAKFCNCAGTELAPILNELHRNEMVQFNPNGGPSGRKKLYRAITQEAAS